jgi:hypothetical protein
VCRVSFRFQTAAARANVIKACLAHSEADKVKAAYNRAEFHAERRGMEAWGGFLNQGLSAVSLRRV